MSSQFPPRWVKRLKRYTCKHPQLRMISQLWPLNSLEVNWIKCQFISVGLLCFSQRYPRSKSLDSGLQSLLLPKWINWKWLEFFVDNKMMDIVRRLLNQFSKGILREQESGKEDFCSSPFHLNIYWVKDTSTFSRIQRMANASKSLSLGRIHNEIRTLLWYSFIPGK